MKRTFIIFIVITLLFAVLPCYGEYTSNASWEEQIHDMGYLILHLSSINAINGMNLTPDQARRLGEMAHEVEAVSERVPDFETIYRPYLAEVHFLPVPFFPTNYVNIGQIRYAVFNGRSWDLTKIYRQALPRAFYTAREMGGQCLAISGDGEKIQVVGQELITTEKGVYTYELVHFVIK